MSKSKPGTTRDDLRAMWREHDAGWKRQGEPTRIEKDAFLDGVLAQYSKAFGMTEDAVFRAIEDRRTYSAVNYYQQSSFPDITGLVTYRTTEAMMTALQPERGFRCPSCNAISKDHQSCDSGSEMAPGKVCDWKSFGLFGTLGKGLRVVVVEQFLQNGVIHDIFMPIALEDSHAG